MGLIELRGNRIVIRLTAEERDTAVRHARGLDAAIVNRLRFGRRDGALLAFELAPPEFDAMMNALEKEAKRTRDRATRNLIERFMDKIFANVLAIGINSFRPDSGVLEPLPPALREEIHRAVGQRHFESVDEFNALVLSLMQSYEAGPQDAHCGLSRDQTSKLVYGEWNAPGGALRFRDDLPLAELEGAAILFNARLVLAAFEELGAVKATSTGRFSRGFVERIVGSMRHGHHWEDFERQIAKVLNEDTVFQLHVLRIVIERAKLIRRAKGHFTLTRMGKRMVSESEAGRLYALLFYTHFHEFSLDYLHRFQAYPNVQRGIAFSFYVLHKLADSWQDLDEFCAKLFLPLVRDELGRHLDEFDVADTHAKTQVLWPLGRFGLVEIEYGPHKKFGFEVAQSVRKTPLFDRFLSFDFS